MRNGVCGDPSRGVSILVIEDDVFERRLIAVLLEREGFRVSTAENGREGVAKLFALRPSLILLDVVMPQMDGWAALRAIRDVADTPVIMVTGLDSELEHVRGLLGGADDYVDKPYGARELVERIKAVLRRAARSTVREVIDDGVVRIDFSLGDVRVRGEPVSLTPVERRLLVAFVEHPNQTLSHGQLLELVWDGFVEPREVRLYVSYLRQKIEADPAAPALIETVRGFGYRYGAARAEARAGSRPAVGLRPRKRARPAVSAPGRSAAP